MKTVLTFLAMLPALFLTAGCNESSEKSKENKIIVMELTKEEFIKRIYDYEKNPNEWKYAGDKPAIVDFHATWCAPCKMLAPVLDEIAKEYKDKIYVYKVDVDKQGELAAIFGVRSVPTILWIPMDDKPSISQGALQKSQMESIVKSTLLKEEE
ncbi:MAG: thioredoxin [Bacteroidales bacterium]|jgi:thioredoxin 1|nr:thioredoxin [Bacteroidales bacterium]HHV40973.1 thioredoxin [Bacteroidales bacterium]